MEGRPTTAARGGRGGGGTMSWRRGGGGGSGGNEGSGGGRGRGGGGGHHRGGRGKSLRDHHRGRGRGGGGHHAGSHHRGPDDGNDEELEDDGIEETFSRRKLESNWDRYAESEREEAADDTPTQKGTDYHVLLGSAGDSFTQFRFSEEKDWEMDSLAASQMSAVFVDLPALAQSLQEMPLHLRLNLEAELVQVSTPVELPILTIAPKQDLGMAASAFKRLNTSQGVSQVTSSVSGPSPQDSCKAAEPPVDDGEEELDQLLGLQKPLSASSGAQPVTIVDEETSAPDQVNTETQASPLSHSQQCAEPEVVETVPEEKMEEVAPVKQEVTEDDLEDWLDSMIS